MRSLRILAVLVSIFLFGAGICAVAQHAGCTQDHGTYTCDWAAFRALLNNSQTVEVHTANMDRFTGVQLKHLAKALGKRTLPTGADMRFEVVPIDSDGIVVGPGNTANAELRISAVAPMTDRYLPVWVERYTGERDRPWASTVNAVIQQFQDRLKQAK